MSLFKDSDLDLFNKNIPEIVEKIKKIKVDLDLEVSDETKKTITDIILSYAKEKKRKLYGGYALDLLIRDASRNKDKIYEDNVIADIDMYSPEPIEDMIAIANILFEKGYRETESKEAMHRETYSIRVSGILYCDLSYVSKNIYNKMPYKEINGLHIIHPHFMTIDYLRMLTDPLTSYWRMMEKPSFERFLKLNKYYPLHKIPNEINLVISKDKNKQDELLMYLTFIKNFCSKTKTTINVGFYAYNHFVLESSYKGHFKVKLLEVPYYEFLTINYKEDAKKLKDELLKYSDKFSKNLKFEEHYPFFQFFGHSLYVYYKNILIAIVYSHNNKCIPYKTVPAITFHNNNNEKANKDETINIGTFSLTLQYALSEIMKVRTDNDRNTQDLYYTFCSHLVELRDSYLKKNKKTIFDNSLFQDFSIDCQGITVSPEKEFSKMVEQRKKKGLPSVIVYRPKEGVKEPTSNYVFQNSSGNPITNEKNLKLTDNIDSESDSENENNQKSNGKR